MLKRNFGSSSLQVSALGFGAGHIGYDGVTERQAHELLDRAPATAPERSRRARTGARRGAGMADHTDLTHRH